MLHLFMQHKDYGTLMNQYIVKVHQWCRTIPINIGLKSLKCNDNSEETNGSRLLLLDKKDAKNHVRIALDK